MARNRKQRTIETDHVQASEPAAAEPQTFTPDTPILRQDWPPVAAPASSQLRMHENLQAKLGRTNRTCPKCKQETFMVAWSKDLPDASTWRQRQCSDVRCGHIEQRIAPPEQPISQ